MDTSPANKLIGKHILDTFDWEGNPVSSENNVKGVGRFRQDREGRYPIAFELSAEIPPLGELIVVEAIENSVEAYGRNGLDGCVGLNVREEGSDTIIEVNDYAGGIPREALEDMNRGATVRISRKKEGRPTNTKTAGGRGYRIMDEAVKRNGGYVTRGTVEEYGRKGTKVTFSIPK